MKHFTKQFPCNNTTVNRGDLVWVTEYKRGHKMYYLGQVTQVDGAGATVSFQTSFGTAAELTFGIFGTRKNGLEGSYFRINPATKENDLEITRLREPEHSKRESVIDKLTQICKTDADWDKLEKILNQI